MSRPCVTIRGSASLMKSYLKFAVNNVLYQRRIYPPEDFSHVQKSGVILMVTCNPDVENYLETILSRVEDWLIKKQIMKVNLMLSSVVSEKVVELWEFKMQYLSEDNAATKVQDKTEDKIDSEIRSVLRQIISTISILPSLEEQCTFDITVNLVGSTETPMNWAQVDDPEFEAKDNISFHRCSSSVHNIDTYVHYLG